MNTIRISEEAKERINHFKLPEYKEIPDIGLFLEQTTKFVSEYLAPLEGIAITGSMISNYVKKKLIANPVKKQYYREQIADIIFIALVKSVLSLEEAAQMLKIQRETYEAQNAYEYFCREFTHVLKGVFGEAQADAEEAADYTVESAIEKELLRKTITAVAYKIYLNEAFKTLEE